MRKLWKPWAAALLGLGLATAPVTAAAEAPKAPGEQQESPGALAREGLEHMMRALRLLVESIPQYELPEILDNGDIIIRRKHDGGGQRADPEFDETAA